MTAGEIAIFAAEFVRVRGECLGAMPNARTEAGCEAAIAAYEAVMAARLALVSMREAAEKDDVSAIKARWVAQMMASVVD